jgi:hypothetical protein
LSKALWPIAQMSRQPAPKDWQGFWSVVRKISAGALIPCFATVIFNALNFFFENYKNNPLPPVQDSIFEVGIGCAFSLVGVCVGAKSHAFASTFLLIFVLLLLLILGGQTAVVLWGWNKIGVMWTTNAVCFVALTWAIIEAE